MKTYIIFSICCLWVILGFGQSITALEYYYNTDPGIGNATALTVNTNTGDLTQSFDLAVPTEMTGFTTIFIRAKDQNDIWSLYDKSLFYISNFEEDGGASSITAAEYYFDALDPGIGNAIPLTVNTNTGNLNQNFMIPIGTMEAGFHKIFIRVKDNLDVWSLYDKRTFFINEDQTLSAIVNAEYFYDTDPGLGNGTPVALVPTENTDEYTVDLATTDISCDVHNVFIRLINADGKWSLYDYALDIEVYDNASPTIVVFPDIVVELDANGEASITITDIDNGTFDDCELVSVVLNQAQFNYTCDDVGENTVTITATDALDNISTQDVIITVTESINPVAITQNITVGLDSNGMATITAGQINNGSTDNCAIANSTLDITTFNCSTLGDNTVTLTVNDTSGNSNTATAVVTVEDTMDPIAIGQDMILDLAGNASVSILASEVDNGSTDNCEIFSLSIDVDTFSEVGEYQVILTVTDSSGNTDSISVTVSVIDSLSIEEVEASKNHITLYPIPAKTELNISTNLIIDSVSIFNLKGKFIATYNQVGSKMDVSNLASGLYFIKFQSENKTFIKRFIKN